MSKTRKRREEAQMPIAGAGLIRFFQDESTGLKVSPKTVILSSILIMLTVLFLYLMFPLT
ncbi:MAG: preprotein translocase subunit Sec61beta [Candidatus Odinarchaeum yellowstonii]|uniref:Preprotein translocase subunit SecG n=1 Tax=Odinarchaeota yellowstonii (strain LCB_4) TaxID=1841599 RepID=A0AAF0IAK9_ODILC|nr:MAG: preprotein translocase subunit Sec61beta [Candidatus Odinarchaeum yellowstonii]